MGSQIVLSELLFPCDGGQCCLRNKSSQNVLGRALLGKRCGLFWICGLLWDCARQPASRMSCRSTGRTAGSSFSLLQGSRQATRKWWVLNMTLRMAGPSPTRKVSIMWRTSCCVLLCIMRADRSCKDLYTRKSCVSWL